MDPTQVINIVFQVILISTILLASFIILIIYFRNKRNEFLREKNFLEAEYQKSLLQSTVEVQESTFSSLARELHDNIGQLLISTKMMISLAQISVDELPENLKKAETTLGKAIDELRGLSKSLNKEWLEQFDLVDNLRSEVARIDSVNDVHIHLCSPGYLSIEPGKQIILFRIIQEALQNALKHAHPRNISIDVQETGTGINVSIKDDGTGFGSITEKKGMGLMNMRHRTRLLQGSINWISNNGTGTSVNIELPLAGT